nr:hypothetical protein [uncultured Roseovarius sp.]
MFKTYIQMPLEDLCAQIFHAARQIADGPRTYDVFVNASERSKNLRVLEMLADGRSFDISVIADLDLLVRHLRSELDSETTATYQVFHGRNDPDLGALGTVETRRELTERGQRLSCLLRDLCRLRHMVEVADARINAERLVNRRLQV